jgi:hypothetical protein
VDSDIEERTVDVPIRRVRKALVCSGCDRLIQTGRTAGHRFSIKNEFVHPLPVFPRQYAKVASCHNRQSQLQRNPSQYL